MDSSKLLLELITLPLRIPCTNNQIRTSPYGNGGFAAVWWSRGRSAGNDEWDYGEASRDPKCREQDRQDQKLERGDNKVDRRQVAFPSSGFGGFQRQVGSPAYMYKCEKTSMASCALDGLLPRPSAYGFSVVQAPGTTDAGMLISSTREDTYDVMCLLST